MELTIHVQAPELARAIEALAAAIGQASPPRFDDGGIIARPTVAVAGQAETAATQAPQTESEPVHYPAERQKASAAVPLEVVRAKLAELSRAGKQAQVKALLAEFGATKLSDVDPSRYGDLMVRANEI